MFDREHGWRKTEIFQQELTTVRTCFQCSPEPSVRILLGLLTSDTHRLTTLRFRMNEVPSFYRKGCEGVHSSADDVPLDICFEGYRLV